jgi:predicted metal-dependent hydrolase
MYFNGSIGRITDYIKTVQLEQKWQQKKIEISTAKPKDSKSVSAFLNPNEDWLKSKRLGDITNKMKSGKRLSHDEEGEGVEKSEGTEKNKKGGKVKFKKAKLTLSEKMAYNGYKINEAKILNKTKFSEPAKPIKQSDYNQRLVPQASQQSS